MREVIDYITRLQDLVDALQKLRLDDREYAYMKAVALFSGEELCTMPLVSGRMGQTHPVSEVRSSQRLALQELRQYLQQRPSSFSSSSTSSNAVGGESTVADCDTPSMDENQPSTGEPNRCKTEPPVERMAQLLLALRSLKSLAKGITEELFFSGLIGEVQIDSVIPFILKMENVSNDLANSDTSGADSPLTTAGDRLRSISASSPGRSSGSGGLSTGFGQIGLSGSPESTGGMFKK